MKSINKKLLIMAFIGLLAFSGLAALTHSQNTALGLNSSATMLNDEKLAKATNAVAPAAGVTPPATAPVNPSPAATAAAPTAATIVQTPLVLSAEQQSVKTALGTRLATQYNGKLSFPLDENKMITFVQLATKVKKINERWDVLVASADTDQMAIEYNNMAVNDITSAMKSVTGLSLNEYNELTRLAAQDPEFNQLYVAYHDMLKAAAKTPAATVPTIANTGTPAIVNGQIAPASASSTTQPPAAGATQPMPATRQTGTGQPTPVVPPVATTPSVSPAAIPASSGTSQALPGSAKPQYSPPVSR